MDAQGQLPGLVAPGSEPVRAPAGHGSSPAGAAVRPGRLRPELLVRSQRPGIVPLRRLTLGDVLDGSLNMIRTSPQGTLGVGGILCGLALLPWIAAVTLLAGSHRVNEGELQVLAAIAPQLALVPAVTALVAAVAVTAHEGALGRRVSLARCWAHLRPRFWSVLLTVLTVSALTLLVLAALIGLAWWTAFEVKGQTGILLLVLSSLLAPVVAALLLLRLVFAPAVAVLEGRGVGGSLRRAWYLTKGVSTQLRLLGWAILATLVAGLAVALVVAGITLATLLLEQVLLADVVLPERLLTAADAVTPFLLLLTAASLACPYLAGVTVLTYLDRRFQLEAYDVTLVRRFQDEAALVRRR